MTISPEFLDEIRARVPVSTAVGRRVKLTRAGRELKGCCPFHNEKTPSFYVNDEKAFYHCFGCGAHGDVIRFVIEQEGLAFRDAVETLAAQAGLEMPVESQGAQDRARAAANLHDVTERAAKWFAAELGGSGGATARAYIAKRGLDADTVKAFGLGLAPEGRTKLKSALNNIEVEKLVETGMLITPEDGGEPYDRFRGRLMFPIRDSRGRVIAFGGRILGDGQPKYLNSPDTPLFDKGRTLYNLDRAGPVARKSGRLIVVEGYMDVISLTQAGLSEVVAPLGTALTEAQLGMLWRIVPEPILCFDGDTPGQKAGLRAAERALPLLQPGQSIIIASLPTGADPDDLVQKGGLDALEAVLKTAKPLYEFIWDSVVTNADVSTPERRALIQKRLRDYSLLIAEKSVRTQYDLIFRERYWQMFGKQVASGSNVINVSFQPKRALQLLRVPIHVHETVSIVIGMLNYPAIVSELIEQIGQLVLPLAKLVTLSQAIIDAVAWAPEITREDLAEALRRQGLAETSADVRRANRLPFSFTNQSPTSEQHASDDLRFCIQIMNELNGISRRLGSACIKAAASHSVRDPTELQIALHETFELEKSQCHFERLGVLAQLYDYVEDRRGLPAQSGNLLVSEVENVVLETAAEPLRLAG